jgi:dTDP-alpha-D-glucose dehydrogenase
MKISIVGFGYIGAVIGSVLSSFNHEIFAIDNDHKTINNLNSGRSDVPEPLLNELIKKGIQNKRLSGSVDYKSVNDSDVVLVTVGTPLSPEFNADLQAIREVFSNLSKHVRSGQIIMVKSTVPPGVTRQMAKEYFGNRDDIYIGFSPERLAEGNAIEEFQTLPIIVGGINDESSEKCVNFWKKTLEVDVIKVSSCEAAELVKLADNQWIDLNIALANELAILCDNLPYDLDILEIISGANSLKKGQHYVNILTPSIGVGGYCLTKDPWFLSALGTKNNVDINLPRYGRMANDQMPGYVAKKIISFLKNKSAESKGLKIAILGYSFKSNSGDVRFTPMKYFIDKIYESGYENIAVFDPTISDNVIENKSVIKDNSWKSCVKDATCVIYGASHDEIMNISISELVTLMDPSGLVYDGRRYFNKLEIEELISAGISYSGVGRSY